MSLLYNFVVAIGFLCFWPYQLYQTWRKGKKFPSLRQRLGFDIPFTQGKEVLWIHAVSVGEVKAVSVLAKQLKKDRFLLVTTQSSTGQEEAKRSIPNANHVAFLPLDISWILNRWVKRLKPKLLVLVEGDFWYHLLKSVKEGGGKTVLVSGRLSEKSSARFAAVRPLAKRLFSQLDALLLQNEEYRQRFLPLVKDPSKLYVTGNLKFDAPFVANLGESPLSTSPFPIAVTCTHSPEEEEILEALAPIPSLLLFLAPRHPERFADVAAWLHSKSIPFIRWSQVQSLQGGERVVLIDAMGQLASVYARSQLAILGGSFSSKVGGHNVLEPCFSGCPVFFGPHMQNQKELVSHVLQAGAGKQLTVADLCQEVKRFQQDSSLLRQAAKSLAQRRGEALAKTLQILASKGL
jgi:3-deoxy-D-manno-octulosonic-acid transferase